MTFELQPSLQDEHVRIEPLQAGDFDALYAVASDPLIWEQHPNRERWRREVFENFFKGALESGGAFRVTDQENGELIGSSRYYDLKEAEVSIGYTFIARRCWGKAYNRALKRLMLDHAFRFVDRVIFEVGAQNLRSRKAMEKLGGVLIGEKQVAYYGEPPRLNVIFQIDAANWVRTD
jgi:RimJ/RimL family protein N-acetyltransferase